MLSPVNEVLEIPELLEPILIHLEFEELFAARRVSRFWLEVLNASLQLRRVMFLSPEDNRAIRPQRFVTHPLYGRASTGAANNMKVFVPSYGQRLSINPLLNLPDGSPRPLPMKYYIRAIDCSKCGSKEYPHLEKPRPMEKSARGISIACALRPTSTCSLSKMFLTQPPVTTMTVGIRGRSSDTSLWNPGGIVVEDLQWLLDVLHSQELATCRRDRREDLALYFKRQPPMLHTIHGRVVESGAFSFWEGEHVQPRHATARLQDPE